MDIILKSEILTVVKILKKSKAEMFENLKVGDKILISAPVKTNRYSGKYVNASEIKIENLGNGECTYKTFNQIIKTLKCFELEDNSK